MEVLGLCSICTRPARYSCSLCGRPVCAEHYDKHNRMCYHCSPDRRDLGHEAPQDRWMLR